MPGLAETSAPVGAIRLHYVGNSRTPLLVVDDFYPEPDALVEAAGEGQPFGKLDDFYPGVRKPLPGHYIAFLRSALPAVLWLAVENDNAFSVSFAQFSMATASPDALLPIQRIPHVDTTINNEWAMVHYLFDNPKDGTAFYRHKETALERVNTSEHSRYIHCLKTQATTVGLPPAEYIQGSTALFDQTDKVDAIYNRAIFYPANVFHSGCIQVGSGLSNVPSRGRLTANCCITIGK